MTNPHRNAPPKNIGLAPRARTIAQLKSGYATRRQIEQAKMIRQWERDGKPVTEAQISFCEIVEATQG